MKPAMPLAALLSRVLRLGFNPHLSSDFPSGLMALANLTYGAACDLLRVALRAVERVVPNDLGAWVHHSVLDVTSAGVSGPLPDTVSQLTNLRSFGGSGNNLSSTLPSTLSALASLT